MFCLSSMFDLYSMFYLYRDNASPLTRMSAC